MFKNFVCPKTKEQLTIEDMEKTNVLTIKSGERKYHINNDIPNLVYPEILPASDSEAKSWYDENAAVYDEYLPLTFSTFDVDEQEVRQKMISELHLKQNMKVLETGAGTGRDSLLIGEQLSQGGELHLTDISQAILEQAVPKFKDSTFTPYFSLVNASYLPYPDNYFDCYYHFGGFNTFSDKKRAFAEIARVVKPGGRVVVGDESMPPWYRNTEFGKILMNSNSHYKYELPLSDMHFTSRDVKIEWIIGGVFYYISYTVADGTPEADFDFEIPGIRGGTHRTRLMGHLEGVSTEAVQLAKEAREKSGKSMHAWLDETIKKAARNELDG